MHFIGSGKTYTIDGLCNDDCGIVPRAVEFLFEHFELQAMFDWKYDLSVSCARITGNEVQDMVAITNGYVNNGNVQIGDLVKMKISALAKFKTFFEKLCQQKKVADSTSSHYMTQISIIGVHTGQNDGISSVIGFIDLAGYENRGSHDVASEPGSEQDIRVIEAVQRGLGITNNSNNLMIAHLTTLQKTFNESVNALKSITNPQ